MGDQQLLTIMNERGVIRFDEPVQLRSGGYSDTFLDGKKALSNGAALRHACQLMIDAARADGVAWDAVGGLTMGADHFAHGVALLAERDWFSIRKQPKGRGTNKWVEGGSIGPGTRVYLVDDVVTTGGSIQEAYLRVTELGAEVVYAATMADRGEVAAEFFAVRDIPYLPLLTYRDLGIAPVERTE